MFIQNVSLEAIKSGKHFNPGPESMLIQITDPITTEGMFSHLKRVFPIAYFNFKEVYQFEFLDLDREDSSLSEFTIADEQAARIAALLKYAYDNGMNVITHCHAGICRSGAVAECGIQMGFEDRGKNRIPNVLVKKKIMQALGYHYDVDEELKARCEQYAKDQAEGKIIF